MTGAHFPLVDLHRHLDGALRLETILDRARQHGLEFASLRPRAQMAEGHGSVADLVATSRFGLVQRVLVDCAACRHVAWENLEDPAREGLAYDELRRLQESGLRAAFLTPQERAPGSRNYL